MAGAGDDLRSIAGNEPCSDRTDAMRAIVVEKPGSAEVLRVVDAPDPFPAAGEISIDVEFAGVGFVDTLFRAGALEFPTPFVPGIEVTGRVREVGAGVQGFHVGEPVAALLNDFGRAPRAGGYAEIATAHASMATVVPDDADMALIAAVVVNGVAGWVALHDQAQLQPTDTVLVLGASGGLGGIVSRLAAIHPARRVIGVVGSEAKRAEAASDCTDVILASEIGSAIDRLTDSAGVDIVLDPVGGDLRAQAYEQLAPFGRHVILGNASGEDTPLSGDSAWLGTKRIMGLSLGGVAHLVPDQITTALAGVVQLVHRGVLRQPAPAIVPMERAADVHQALEGRTAPAKTVLAVQV